MGRAPQKVNEWLTRRAYPPENPRRSQEIDSGEGRWTVREGLDLGVPLPVTAAALNVRLASQGRGDYGARFLARLRNAFGGHAVKTE